MIIALPNATQSFFCGVPLPKKAIMNILPNTLPDGKPEFKGNQNDNDPFEEV